jgi:hypothetical protein
LDAALANMQKNLGGRAMMYGMHIALNWMGKKLICFQNQAQALHIAPVQTADLDRVSHPYVPCVIRA